MSLGTSRASRDARTARASRGGSSRFQGKLQTVNSKDDLQDGFNPDGVPDRGTEAMRGPRAALGLQARARKEKRFAEHFSAVHYLSERPLLTFRETQGLWVCQD